MNKSYVYRHRRLDNYEVFYVGIGSNKYRAYNTKTRSSFWKKITNKTKYQVEILAENLSWEDACDLEKLLISEYGRKNLSTGSLCNLTDGGEGTLGRKVSEKTKNKISQSNIGKKASKETIENLKKSHLGIKLSEKSIIKRTINSKDIICKKNKTSKYKGVCWSKSKNKWRASIHMNKKQNHLGYFDTEIEAHKFYQKHLEDKITKLKQVIE